MLIIGTGLLQAWSRRFRITADALSYLELADLWRQGEWWSALNAYWSPLQSWWMALVLAVVRPSLRWESTTIQFAQVVVLAIGLRVFEGFWGRLGGHRPRDGLTESQWWAAGYGLFGTAALSVVTTWQLSPDLWVLVWLLAVAHILVAAAGSNELPGSGSRPWVCLGVLVALACMTKIAMLPILIWMDGVTWAFGARRSRWWIPRRGVLAAVVALVVSAPFVVALSVKQGRFTVGDAPRLNHAWYVGQVFGQGQHWQGDEPGFGTARHPTRLLHRSPMVFEFSGPIEGTYPPWLDPSYWHEGLQTRFDPSRQIEVISENLELSRAFLLRLGLLALPCLALLTLGKRRCTSTSAVLWLWAVGSFVMYALIHIETRFLGAMVLFLFAGILVVIRQPQRGGSRAARYWIALQIGALWVGVIWSTAAHLVRAELGLRPEESIGIEHRQVADGLTRLGVQPGDGVAFVGLDIQRYWARLAGVQTVAEVMARKEVPEVADNVDVFWRAQAEVRAEVIDDFARAGASWVVARHAPPQLAEGEGWQQLPGTSYFVLAPQPYRGPEAVSSTSP